MTRQFCDRCGADVTDRPSASVQIVNNADLKGDGVVNTSADLCTRCRRELTTWLQSRKK